MKRKITISESSFDEQDYYNTNKISQQTRKKGETDEIIACPQKHTDGKYYFAQDTIDFLKFCRDQTPDYPINLLKKLKISYFL
ncbi:MAG: hypothetical protein IKG87_03725 [Clostridia bacterium]|nr:hypothetical protein [Clostridia bacterium]